MGTLGKGTLGRLLVIVLPEIEKRGKTEKEKRKRKMKEKSEKKVLSIVLLYRKYKKGRKAKLVLW